MIALIDYDAGNLKSVEKALQLLGEEVIVTRNPEEILSADKVILPGVGCFKDAMDNLHQYGLVSVIHQVVEQKTPFLGICLGLQLLFERSDKRWCTFFVQTGACQYSNDLSKPFSRILW